MMTETGTSRVTIGGNSWVVCPATALWIPAETQHVTQIGRRPAVTRSVFLSHCLGGLGKRCVPIAVTALLRELILEFARLDPLYNQNGAGGRVLAVLLDQLRPTPMRPVMLGATTDPHVQRITEHILRHPEDRRNLREWASIVGSSEKTLTRRFLRDTQMGFREWRQRARLLKALELLAEGEPVLTVAFNVGYESTSAFAALFKAMFGVSPGAYQDSRLHEDSQA